MSGSARDYDKHTEADILSMLEKIPCTDHDTWFNTACSVHSWDSGSPGFTVFSRWANDYHDKTKTIATWKSLDKPFNGRRKGVGSLIFAARAHGWVSHSSGWREAGAYIYAEDGINRHRTKRFVQIDKAGNDVFGKNKKPIKKFPIEHWAGDEWVKNQGEVARVLYQADLLKAALLDHKVVLWVEGEKCADKLIELGFTATTSMQGSGGAKQLWSHNYARYFKPDHKVVILPDQDNDGVKYANAVGAMLAAANVEVGVLQLENLEPSQDVIDWLAKGGTVETLLALIETAPAWEKPEVEEQAQLDVGELDHRGEPLIIGDDPDKIIMETQERLLETGGLYQRGGKIVIPDMIQGKNPYTEEETYTPGIAEFTTSQMWRHASKHIAYREWNRGKLKAIPIPKDYAAALIDLTKAELKFPVLNSLITAPIVTKLGRVIQEDGYDKPTGFFLDKKNVNFITVEAKPTKDEAIEAGSFLLEPFKEYPFKDLPQRSDDPARNIAALRENLPASVAVSGLLTGVNRLMVPNVPGLLVSGNGAGVGKGTLIYVITYAATGVAPAIMTQATNKEEFEKALATKLLNGSTMISIDNVSNMDVLMQNDLLDITITEPRITRRIMGFLRELDVPNTFFVTITGHGLKLSLDKVRRFVRVEIETAEESPEFAKFSFSPVEFVREN